MYIIRRGREKTKKFAIKLELKVLVCFINTSHTTILTRDVRVKIIPFKINPIEFHLDTHIVCVIAAVTLKKKKKDFRRSTRNVLYIYVFFNFLFYNTAVRTSVHALRIILLFGRLGGGMLCRRPIERIRLPKIGRTEGYRVVLCESITFT